jgi:hypothetical protein
MSEPLDLDRRKFLAGAISAVAVGSVAAIPAKNRAAYAESKEVRGIKWLSEPLKYRECQGDTWSTTWADDGHVYAVADDTLGLKRSIDSNLAIFRFEGKPPGHTLHLVNPMLEYGKSAQVERGDTWKGAGLVSVDGVLYLGVGQHSGALDYPDNVQFAYDGSIVKSVDHGKTWSAKPKAGQPWWFGPRFATPFFVQFGQDYREAMDEFVYAVSNACAWNNGDYMVMARVSRKLLPHLNPNHWEFFGGADANNNPTWIKTPYVANHPPQPKAIFQHRGYTSMTGIQYVPAIKRFMMTQWAYMDLDLPSAGPNPWFLNTMLCLYEAPKPWGPWRVVHIEEKWGKGNYGPSIPAAWFENGGRQMWMIYAGCWMSDDYAPILRQLKLEPSACST